MAVEKLILRSIVYGVDKIPDSWFNFVPGGYYKAKDGEIKKMKPSDRPSQKKDPRQEERNQARKARKEDLHDANHRSERGREHPHRRSSYDGGADDDYYYYSEGDHPRRSKSRRGYRGSDNHRYGPDDASRVRSRYGQPQDYHNSHRHDDIFDARYGRRRSHPNPDTMRGPNLDPPPIGPYRAQGSDLGTGYVPYAHIYGNRRPEVPQHTAFSQAQPRRGPHYTTSEDPSDRIRVNRHIDGHPASRPVSNAAGPRAGGMSDGQKRFNEHGGRDHNSHGNRDRGAQPRSGHRSHYKSDDTPYPDNYRAIRTHRAEARSGDVRSRYVPQSTDSEGTEQTRAREMYVDPRKPLSAQVSTARPQSDK